MTTEQKPKYGLLIEEKPEDKVLGSANSIPFETLQADGNWEPSLPVKEFQNLNAIEPFACVPFTILNCTEALIFKKYGLVRNYSDRFLAAVADTRGGGTTYQKACDFLRKIGVPLQEVWPFDSTIDTTDKFFAPIPPQVYELAREFNAEWELSYERVPSTHEAITKALTSSPLLFSVYAWKEKDGIYYRPEGQTDIHATTLFYQREGVFRQMFDSYDAPHIKDYRWSDLPLVCVRFHLRKKTPQEEQIKKTLLDTIAEAIKRIFVLIGLLQEEVKKKIEPPPPVVIARQPQPVIELPIEKLKWAFPSDARKSVRILCDEMGLTLAEKDLICQVIRCESGFKIDAKNENKDEVGKVLSTDWGICQINDYYHIGAGKSFPSVQFVLENPEASIRFMIKMFKAGKLNLWVCYKAGLYKRYSA